jgi:hypothetical protein
MLTLGMHSQPVAATLARGAVRETRAATLWRAISTCVATNENLITAAPYGNKRINNREIREITVALIARIAEHLAHVETQAGRKGSILCFLLGWDEINQAMTALDNSDPTLADITNSAGTHLSDWVTNRKYAQSLPRVSGKPQVS